MAEKAIYEMISAFASGCMDKDNFSHFKEYLQSGGELPPGELGELQNVMAVIPAILDIEEPDAKLKDKVAKKLIGMQDEIKAKIQEERRMTSTFGAKDKPDEKIKTIDKQFKSADIHSAPPEKVTVEPVQVSNKAETLDHEPAHTETRHIETHPGEKAPAPEPHVQRKITTEAYQAPPLYNQQSEPENRPSYSAVRSGKTQKVKSGGFSAGSLTAIFLAVILFLVAAFFIYKLNHNVDSQTGILNNEITSLKNELSSTKEFINNYGSLVEFFNYNDIEVINLTPGALNINASGKFLLAYKEREGLLQLNNVPAIPSSQSYQLWVVSKGQSYPIGVINPEQKEKYIRISNFPYIPKEDIDFIRLTIERRGGSDIPMGQVVLYGELNNNTAGVPGRGRKR